MLERTVIDVGQYFFPVIGDAHGEVLYVFDRSVDGRYTGAKLMEHSWMGSPCCRGVTEQLQLHGPCRLAWVGDYVKDADFDEAFRAARRIPADVALLKRTDVFGETVLKVGLHGPGAALDGRVLVNLEQRVYIDVDEYCAAAQLAADDVVYPLSLLTAVGNGRGGGDYLGTCMDFVGAWAWNLISVAAEPPDWFTNVCPVFVERRW